MTDSPSYHADLEAECKLLREQAMSKMDDAVQALKDHRTEAVNAEPLDIAPMGEPVVSDGIHSVPVEGGADDDDRNPKDKIGSKKPPLQLVPPAALIYMAMAMKDGAFNPKKMYGPYNWREKKISAMQYVSATKRHIDAWLDGEENTRDSNVPHLGAALASLAILVDCLTCGALIDDRPLPGAAADLLDQFTEK